MLVWFKLQIFLSKQKLVQVLGQTYGSDAEEKIVFVLTANSLQKWQLIKDEEPDKMYFNSDLETIAKEAFATASVWVRQCLSFFNFYYRNNFSFKTGTILLAPITLHITSFLQFSTLSVRKNSLFVVM